MQKMFPKWDPKTEVKIAIFWPKRSTGVTVILSTLPSGGALSASWVFLAPKMAQEPAFDVNLPQICVQN